MLNILRRGIDLDGVNKLLFLNMVRDNPVALMILMDLETKRNDLSFITVDFNMLDECQADLVVVDVIIKNCQLSAFAFRSLRS